MTSSTYKNYLYAAAGVAVLLFTRLAFLVHPQLSFDSDSAITGIAALHISRGEAFPVFSYGQSYIIAVEPWLAAPFFRLMGATVAALKTPLLLLNVFCLLFMMREFRRGAGLSGARALAACSFFAAPAALMACRLTDSMGGNIESFAWVMLLWAARRRPVLFGAIAALGTLNRTFTAFGAFWAAAFFIYENRAAAAGWLSRALPSAAAIFGAARYYVLFYSDNAGAGLSGMAAGGASPGAGLLFSNILPAAFGLRPAALGKLGLLTSVTANPGALSAAAALLLAAMAALFGVSLFRNTPRADAAQTAAPAGSDHFPLFLILTGVSSLAFYILFGARLRDVQFIRYVLFVILIPCGAAAMFFRRETSRARVAAFISCAALAAAINIHGAAALWSEYSTHPPVSPHRKLASFLLKNGITRITADYWTAYHLSFITTEKIIAATPGKVIVKKYNDEYLRDPSKFVQIKDAPCANGDFATLEHWHICRIRAGGEK